MAQLGKKPEIRCRQVLGKLKALESLDPEARNRILRRFSKTSLQAINESKKDQWIPIECNTELCDCVAAEIGEGGTLDWSKKATQLLIRSSHVGAFFIAAFSMINITASTAIKLSPHLWNSIYRNAGSLSSFEESKGIVHVTMKDLAEVMVASRPSLISTTGFIQALLDVDKGKWKARLDQISESKRQALIVCTMETER